jgi:aspartate/methionine/tyrosine aminotransferase
MKRELDRVVAALGRFTGDPINLLVGEPCFEPPAEIQREFRRIAAEPAAGYGPPAGDPVLRSILAEREGIGALGPENVVVTHGAKGGLLALFAALIEPGDEIIHPLPCYPAYPTMIRRFGGVPVGVVERGNGYADWVREMFATAGQKTRAVVLSSPSNPSGTTLGSRELRSLVHGCDKRGIRLILDEAYSAYRFSSSGVEPSADDVAGGVVRVGSASKTLALCGWRIGWVIAATDLAERVTDAQAALLNPPATPPQRAMLALPDVPDGYFYGNRRAVYGRLETMVASMRGSGFDVAVPEGGFYLWVDVRDRLDPVAADTAIWCEQLAEEHGVGLWPGEDFGVLGWVRLALPQGDGWRENLRD